MDKIFKKNDISIYNPSNIFNGLHCVDIGYKAIDESKGDVKSSTNKPFTSIIVCLEGQGEIVFKKNKVKIKKDSILLVPPCGDYSNRRIGEGLYRYVWLSFDGVSFEKYFSKSQELFQGFLNNSNIDKIVFLITKFLIERKQENQIEIEMLTLVLQVITLIQNKRVYNTEDEYVDKITSIISSNFENASFKIESISKELHLSHSWLCALYKNKTKHSMQQVLMSMRISKAKDMLKNSKASLKNIAYLSGFNDVLYFSAIFKKHVGVSPSQFRKDKHR